MSIIFEHMKASHLDELVALWNKELVESFPMRLRLLQQNTVEDRIWLQEGSWVAIEQGSRRVVGFIVAKIASKATEDFGIPRDLGWIQVLMVDRQHRSCGIGTALLRKAEEALRNAGAKHIMIGNDLNRRLFPGIPDHLQETKQWFEKRAYTFKEISYDLLNDYGDDFVVSLPDVHEATFRTASLSDREALTAFMHRCFPGTWDYQHRDYWEQGGTGREFVLLEREGSIIGFCRMNDSQSPLLAQNIYWAPLFEGELGGVGPLGIDESFRGHKYGISIVQAAIHYLLQRGVQHVVIDTTPYVDFYGKLGYRSWKSYARYDKVLN